MKTNQAQRARKGGGVGIKRMATGRKKKEDPEVRREMSPFEDVVISEELEREIRLSVAKQVRDKTVKRLTPEQLHHAILRFMVLLPKILKMSPSMVARYTHFSRQQLFIMQPHVDPMDDLRISLLILFRWCLPLRLDMVKVMGIVLMLA